LALKRSWPDCKERLRDEWHDKKACSPEQVRFDLDGTHYGQGKGLKVFVEGKMAQSSPTMAKLTLQL
jgi:hypothetical protein